MSDRKWMCSLCTYYNWEASIKCVLCGSSKTFDAQLNQEIYNLNLSEKSTTIPSNATSDNKTKWACSACTYLNWPKARKCVQCSTVRSKHSSPALSQTSSSDEQTSYPKGKESTQEKMAEIKATSSDHLLNVEKKQESFNLSRAFQKWACNICTYENWPKSKQCVMCFSDSYVGKPMEVRPNTENVAVEKPKSENKSKKSNLDRHSIDILWLEACTSVLDGNLYAFESYLMAMNGQLDRKLTSQECRILNQPDIFHPGLTLLELAFKMGRDDFIEVYLASSVTPSEVLVNPPIMPILGPLQQQSQQMRIHRMPCHACPDRAIAIQAHLLETMRMRKGDFPCFVVQEHSTFWVPQEVDTLPPMAKRHLLDELVDQNVMRELEVTEKVINWWCTNNGTSTGGGKNSTVSLSSSAITGGCTNAIRGAHNSPSPVTFSNHRLTALWNRTAGDCLLDSVLQASWAILDRDNVLRTALADSMRDAQHIFYPRWREYEHNQARAFNYTINELQYRRDWQNLLRIACQQGEPLEQVHIFVLCHILRRPIIVYGVRYINNHRNEPVGFAHFQGVYLPLLWERSYCSRNPIVLGYTRGHFSALVPSETMLNSTDITPVIPTTESNRTRHGGTTSAPVIDPNSIMRLSPEQQQQKSEQQKPHVQQFNKQQQQLQHGSQQKPGQVTIPVASCDNRLTTGGTMDSVHPQQQRQQQPQQLARNGTMICFLPLYDYNKQFLPVHFLSQEESQSIDSLLREWLDVAITRRGYLMAKMRCTRRHPLVDDLLEGWLEMYRRHYELYDEEDDDDDDEECDEDDDEEDEECYDVEEDEEYGDEDEYGEEDDGARSSGGGVGGGSQQNVVACRRYRSVSPPYSGQNCDYTSGQAGENGKGQRRKYSPPH